MSSINNPTLPYHILPYPIQPYPTLPYPSPPYPTSGLSSLALPYPTLLYPTLPYPTLPYPTLPYLTLTYPTLSYPTLPYSYYYVYTDPMLQCFTIEGKHCEMHNYARKVFNRLHHPFSHPFVAIVSRYCIKCFFMQ